MSLDPRPFLSRLRPRWAWICLALGLPWLLTPLSCRGRGACVGGLSALCFWAAVLVLGFLAARWLWRRFLFKVSRRLWLILLLLSFLPALTLTVFFVSAAWLGLGAQVSRSIQGNIQKHEAVLRQAAQAVSDAAAIQELQGFGEAWTFHTEHLPRGLKPGFLGLVYDRGRDGQTRDTFLRVVSPDAQGRNRLLTLSFYRLATDGNTLLGGRTHYRLDWGQQEDGTIASREALAAKAKAEADAHPLELSGLFSSVKPVDAWIQGKLQPHRGLLHPFPLPPVSLRVVDWETGRPMLLTLTPETSLVEIFKGFGFDRGNLSAESALAIFVIVVLLFFLFAIQGVALLMGLLLARNLGRSVDSLSKGVSRLSAGDFSVRIRLRGRDQVAQLTRAFNDMAERLEKAARERDEQLRLEEELRVAREVQMRLLPDVSALAPAIQAVILPAREVAGDYFDLFKLPDGRYAFFIADVSGKGTSAAFYAAETKGVLAALDKAALDPIEVLARLNAIWCATHPRQVFLTAVYGLFDPGSGAFRFARAGHPAGFLRRADARIERFEPRGIAIGMSPDRFGSLLGLAKGHLEPGDSLLFFTDGLSEAQDPAGAFFGEARLEWALASGSDPKLAVLAAVDAFLNGRPLEDDLTLLVLSR